MSSHLKHKIFLQFFAEKERHIIIVGNEFLEFGVEIVAGTDKLHHLLVREFVPWVLFP
jgi:hypothetical protein